MAEKVNHPKHYRGKIEVIDYIEEYSKNYPEEMIFDFGNVIKYVSRAPRKNGKEDLEKARWYLDRMIKKWDECMTVSENVVEEWIGTAAEEINADRKALSEESKTLYEQAIEATKTKMKTMRCELVQQIVSYREVGTELRDRMDALSDCGYSIKSVIETVASNNTKNKQGFIVIYECDIPNRYKEENKNG